MHFSTLVHTLAFFSATGLAGYVLEDDYFEQGFFQQFDFFSGTDPTQGFVEFQDHSDAQSKGLIEQGNGYVKLMVDSSNITPNGRPSVRLGSTKTYSSGLVVADISHMPGGICGTWPAFWMLGPNWPDGGEIDIFEGKNDQTCTNVTLHTGSSCSISQNNLYSGEMGSTYCGPTSDNTGCQISSTQEDSYGAGFNAAGGGIYATEWTSSVINVWFLPNGSTNDTVKSNVLSDAPDPSTWGSPLASFSGTCDMATAFVDQQIIIDTTFCGTWAGNTWGQSETCMAKATTCEDFVANNPEAFEEAFWTFNALRVYKSDGGALSSASVPAYSPSSTAAASSMSAPAYSPTPDAALSISSSTEAAATYAAPSTSPGAASSYVAPSSSATSPSTYAALSPSALSKTTITVSETSIVYVTAPASPEGYAPSSPTTFAVSTVSAAAQSANGYAPVVGEGGGVEQADSHLGGGLWSTGPDGNAIYEGKRHARHLGVHRRR